MDNNVPNYYTLRLDEEQKGPEDIKSMIHLISVKNLLFDIDLSSDEDRMKFTNKHLIENLSEVEEKLKKVSDNNFGEKKIYNLQYEKGTYWDDC